MQSIERLFAFAAMQINSVGDARCSHSRHGSQKHTTLRHTIGAICPQKSPLLGVDHCTAAGIYEQQNDLSRLRNITARRNRGSTKSLIPQTCPREAFLFLLDHTKT